MKNRKPKITPELQVFLALGQWTGSKSYMGFKAWWYTGNHVCFRRNDRYWCAQEFDGVWHITREHLYKNPPRQNRNTPDYEYERVLFV